MIVFALLLTKYFLIPLYFKMLTFYLFFFFFVVFSRRIDGYTSLPLTGKLCSCFCSLLLFHLV